MRASPARVPRVSIVLLNWRTPQETIDCIRTLRRLDYGRYDIIIVDNDSGDDSEARIRAEFPELPLLQSGGNLGYAGGNNLGIRYALERGAELIWLLNNDTLVAPDALTLLVNAALGMGADMVGPLLVYEENGQVQFDGGDMDWLRCTTHGYATLGRSMPRDRPYPTGLLHGASMLVRRHVFEQIGLIPDLYFLNYEETEFCVRATRAGFTMVIEPRAVVRHLVSAGQGRLSPAYFYYMHRNQAIFMRRNASLARQSLFFPGYVAGMAKGWLAWSVRRRPKATTVFLRALLDGCLMRTGRVSI